MHAAVLADQPFEVALRILVLREAHHRPRVFGEVAWVVVKAGRVADVVAQIVPLHAVRLTRLAAYALRHVDQLRHRAHDRHAVAGRRRGRRGNALDIERLQCHFPPPYAFSTFTRNDLNSGVCEFPLPTEGVSVLTR